MNQISLHSSVTRFLTFRLRQGQAKGTSNEQLPSLAKPQYFIEIGQNSLHILFDRGAEGGTMWAAINISY